MNIENKIPSTGFKGLKENWRSDFTAAISVSLVALDFSKVINTPLFKELQKTVNDTKMEAYVIGGFVRDHLLNRPNKKDIDIVNSGIDGQSTFGHIWNFNNWYNKLNSFSPKYLIFYIGINDQLYLSPEEIKKKRKNYDNPRDSSNLNLFMKIKNILRKNNGIVYRGYTLLRDLISKNKDYFEVGHSPKREKMNYKIPSKKFLINIKSKKNFLDNLNMLYKYTIEIDAIPIFITQKTMRGNKISNKIVSISEFDYFSYEKKISNMIIDYCNDKEILCINVNELLDLTTNDTYDRVHLVPSGSKKLSVLLFDKLKYELKF